MLAMSRVAPRARPDARSAADRGFYASVSRITEARRIGRSDKHDHDGRIPLFVPISLMRQYGQQFAIDYPNRQTYVELYSIELTDCRKSQFAGCPLLRVRRIQAL